MIGIGIHRVSARFLVSIMIPIYILHFKFDFEYHLFIRANDNSLIRVYQLVLTILNRELYFVHLTVRASRSRFALITFLFQVEHFEKSSNRFHLNSSPSNQRAYYFFH